MAVLLAFLAFLFLGFHVRAGLLLRITGVVLFLSGIAVLAGGSRQSSDEAVTACLIGIGFWLLGHWAYAFAHSRYKSSLAERLIEKTILPRLHIRSGRYATDSAFALRMRIIGLAISRLLTRDSRTLALPGAEIGGGTPDQAIPRQDSTGGAGSTSAQPAEQTEAGEEIPHTRLGVPLIFHERLRARLAGEEEVSAGLRKELEQAQAREQARQGRLEAVLAESTDFVDRLDSTTGSLARVFNGEPWEGEIELKEALSALFNRRAESIEFLEADSLSRMLREFLLGHGGRATWMAESTNEVGEPHLKMTAALAGERAVIVNYAQGAYEDGPWREVAERVCHAVACSLQARDLARLKGRRLPVSLLGDENALRRFSGLLASRGVTTAMVSVSIDSDQFEEALGAFGEAAWNAALFELAVELDSAAREAGGEAFEVDRELVCVVAEDRREALRAQAEEIIAKADVKARLVGQ